MPPDGPSAGLLADLNAPQQQAVQHRDGPLLVIAGPGSGKTRVITRRAAYLVHAGIPARNILAITFTNKAADEMKRRIEALGVARGMWVYTFHALGVRLIREFGPLARVQPGFTIYDETDSTRLVKEALEAEGISESYLKADYVRQKISDAKNRLDTPDDLAAHADWHQDQTIARVYGAYERLLEARNAVDFDDLLMRVAVVLRDHPEVTERLNLRFRYVLIDEYQDTNHAQYLIARYLSQHHRNICATGDPDQSIYAWRGADIRNILEFERDYPDAVVVRLEQNYRSTGNILRVASRLIDYNRQRKHKELWTAGGAGDPVHVWQFMEGREEAVRIAESIRTQHASAGRPWSDFAIFYRINAISRGLEDELRLRGIPYRIARGVEFYNRKEIRDVLAYLRLLANPADDIAALRVINTPARGIGKTTLEKVRTCANELGQSLLATAEQAPTIPALQAVARKLGAFTGVVAQLRELRDLPVSELVSQVLLRSGLEQDLRAERDAGGEDRLANVQELVTAALRYEQETDESSLADFLNRISLVSDQDAVDEHAGNVMLMTLHAAKGLEFPVVYLVGLEQGLLPHEWALQQGGNIEEERRLCFVGLTRAREQLFVTRAHERMIRGRFEPRPPSQFLHEIDDGQLDWRDFQSASGSLSPRPRAGGPPVRDGFVPLVDDLPPEEAARLVPRRRLAQSFAPRDFDSGEEDAGDARRSLRAAPADEPPAEQDSSPDLPARPPRPPAQPAVPAGVGGWVEGMLVQHDRYGVGQIVWVRGGAGQTRASVRFAGYGEKTLILELAPIRRLERGNR